MLKWNCLASLIGKENITVRHTTNSHEIKNGYTGYTAEYTVYVCL